MDIWLVNLMLLYLFIRNLEGCQQPYLPVYNATGRRYLTCNSWEPDCPPDTMCQRANSDWKERLYVNPEFAFYLCCNKEGRLTVNQASLNGALGPHALHDSTGPLQTQSLAGKRNEVAYAAPQSIPRHASAQPFSHSEAMPPPYQPSQHSATEPNGIFLAVAPQHSMVAPSHSTHSIPSLNSGIGSAGKVQTAQPVSPHPHASPAVHSPSSSPSPTGPQHVPSPLAPSPAAGQALLPAVLTHQSSPSGSPASLSASWEQRIVQHSNPQGPPLSLPPHLKLFSHQFESQMPSAHAKVHQGQSLLSYPLRPQRTNAVSPFASGQIHPPSEPSSQLSKDKLALLPPQPQVLAAGNGNRLVIGPNVVLLLGGEFSHLEKQPAFLYKGTVTLIQDVGQNILVDTGSANCKNKVIAALAQHGLKPHNIQIVIYTHAHPDHMGNDNLFPYAQKFFAGSVYKGDEFLPLQQLQDSTMRLTQNVEIWKTPGHTIQHNSVIVRNVTGLYGNGTVAIAGDLFLNERDLDSNDQWAKIAVDKEMQRQSRNKLLCQADYIVPGHGTPFAVTTAMRTAANCPARQLLARRITVARKKSTSKRSYSTSKYVITRIL